MTWLSNGTSSGLKLGPATNTFTGADLAAAATSRDNYFSANPTKLAAYDSDSNSLIRLVYEGVTTFQGRSGGSWVDYSPVLQGQPGEVASLVNVPNGQVPYKLPDGTFGGSRMRVLDDGSLLAPPNFGVESGSVKFGDVLVLSEAAGFLAINNKLNGKAYTILDYATPRDSGSERPVQFRLTAEASFNAQPISSTTITANPKIVQYTVQNTARNNALTFKTSAPMSNVRFRIVKQSNGVTVKYAPSKEAWETEQGGMDWVAGDNTYDFEDTPIIFNSGDVIRFEFYATTVTMLGNPAGTPYIVSTQQLGEFHDVVMDDDYTATDVRDKLAGLTGANRLDITSIKNSVTTVAGRSGAIVLSVSDVAGLASVASSGAYADLTGKPTIPTLLSQLTNDSGYLTSVPVTSVAGRTGDVVVSASDVGLGNVNNTSDVNKPTSTAQQASIDLKLTQHNAAADPHPQYTTTAEASAAAPVQTVNTLTGNVVLTTGNVPEGGSLYFTDTRVGAYLTTNGYTVKSVASVGSGAAVFKDTTAGVTSLKSLTAGRGMTVAGNTNDVNIGSTAFPLVYNVAGAAASPKIWYGTATSDANGDFTVNYSSAGFTVTPIIHVTATLTTGTLIDRAWATLQANATTTSVSGYTLRGVGVLLGGNTVRTAPNTVVMIMAIGT